MKYDTEIDLQNKNSTYGLIADHIVESSEVLDIGCATGNLAKALASAKRCTVLGIDVDPDATRCGAQSGNLSSYGGFDRVDASAVCGDRQFEVVILADVLQHLYDPVIVQLRSSRSWKVTRPLRRLLRSTLP